MLPIIPKPPITPRQKKAALAVAGAVDLLQLVVFPAIGLGIILDEALDFVAAIALTAICGFKWQFLVAFLLELVPIADLIPTWSAVVLMLGTTPSPSSQVNVSSVNTSAPPPVQPRTYPDSDVVDVEAVRVPPVRPPQLPH